MRLSTAHTYDAGIDNLQRRQLELAEQQMQMTSGKRVNRASDDPTAAARAERAMALEARSVASQRAVEASRNAMQTGESALGDATELLQQARETLVAAGNGSYSDSERSSLVQALRGIRNQLFAVANRSDGSGGFVFGGQGSSAPPFVERPLPEGVAFVGTAGQTVVASGEALPVTLDGEAAWLQARTGNGVFETQATTQGGSAWIDAGNVGDPAAVSGNPYSLSFSVDAAGVATYTVLQDGLPTALTNVAYQSGTAIEIDGLSFKITGQPADGDQFDVVPSEASLNVFKMLDRAAIALETLGLNGGQVTQAVTLGLRDIDASLGRLQSQRALAGEALNRIDGVEDRLAAVKLGAKVERSSAEDLDMVEAISKFQQQQTGYEAALKSYSMVQRLSLFQYINP
ncbi:flagellar hook-associated protein FlgL [Methylibium sp.]|uniref:flagellar hook-associated protein FlgL n=1 Tax=Methylibium sp. TaxID=2067992 RepID=UPI00185A5B78|nr:flagellar hook-associated protein FlgL [Methylibium sp.]MBA3589190.1 flagellar hook-associated protein FlgL [Methylibium sp.]